MNSAEQAFPTRLLTLGTLEARTAAADVHPQRINQHIEGRPDGRRVMTDEEVAELLGDPMATLVLRRGRFPRTLGELLNALDEHNDAPNGVPQQSSFLISEGGQIRFRPGLDKGGSRLVIVRSRRNSPELLISTLFHPGDSPRDDEVLNEVIAWDPENRTFHYYQRQAGAWFWCGQSDMALEEPTLGKGPFDSHASGYPVMKELKTPWVHWHGPGLGIAETAYATDDPFVSDPLFADKETALTFENRAMRPLCERWNVARFEKASGGDVVSQMPMFMRQVVDSPAANLISTHKQWSEIDRDGDLNDLPPTFFFDQDSLISELGVPASVPPLVMARRRYKALVERHDLRVRGGSVDMKGDVPFCFTVPERAFEDVLVVRILVQRGVLSDRLAACLLMVDFTNPLDSPKRASLLRHVPATAGTTETTSLDATLVPAILEAASANAEDSPENEFAAHWNLGGDGWRDGFGKRIESYLAAVVAKLDTDAGCDEIFRLAESRRRDFRRRASAEFGLSLPQAVGIPPAEPRLEMTEAGSVQRRP